mmetsp:Transcript_34034/g.96411  ORF Transcript_34034/g.96411 Transcript_34034/m.96411 type:complete len:224 (-) Transcript_34034:220-891(-)
MSRPQDSTVNSHSASCRCCKAWQGTAGQSCAQFTNPTQTLWTRLTLTCCLPKGESVTMAHGWTARASSQRLDIRARSTRTHQTTTCGWCQTQIGPMRSAIYIQSRRHMPQPRQLQRAPSLPLQLPRYLSTTAGCVGMQGPCHHGTSSLSLSSASLNRCGGTLWPSSEKSHSTGSCLCSWVRACQTSLKDHPLHTPKQPVPPKPRPAHPSPVASPRARMCQVMA